MKSIPAVVLVAAALGAAGCSDPDGAVPLGRWGGRNAELVVTVAGASARFKCGASGSIAQRLTVDATSTFDVPGSFVTPVLAPGVVQPGRYTGSVSGSDMTLALSVAGQPAGTFQLRQGAEATFDVCNF
jgi:hypothetical protein